LESGGNAPAVLNAANEVAVEAFLAGQLPFLGIADTIAAALDAVPRSEMATLDDVYAADRAGRQAARTCLEHYRS